MKINFEYFQTEKWILQTGRSEELGEKNGVVCLVPMFPFWVMMPKLSEKVHFLVKIHFDEVHPSVHSGLQNTSILGKSYQFGQLIILF